MTMKTLAKYFVNGLLFLIPLAATVYVVYWVFSTVDGAMRTLILGENGQDWWISGLGVVISLAVITGVGVLTSLFITKPILQLIEKLFSRLPLVKLLYSSVKDLIGAFVGDKKKFDQPVLVNLMPGSSVKTMGFITRKSLKMFSLQNEVAVYCPHSYNFSGMLLIVPADQIQLLDADSSEVMAFIVSGGVSGGTGPGQTAPKK